MITLRRSNERYHDRRRKQEVWLTFHPQARADSLADGFGALEIFDEDRLAPGGYLAPHPPHDAPTFARVRSSTRTRPGARA